MNRGSLSIKSRLADLDALAWLSRIHFRRTIRREIATYDDHVARHRYGGHELAVSLEDPTAEAWYDHDWPLTPELARLGDSRLAPGARVFDLGAHQGVLALILARLVGPAGQVVAVEAERHNFEVATRNRDLNDASNLEILHAAGGAREGRLYFSGGLNGTVAKRGRMGHASVRALSVDGLADRYGAPDVVLVDVEGYEHEVLRGASRTLTGGITDFFVEVHVGHGLEALGGSARAVLGYFDPVRFQLLVSPARGELDDYEFAPLDEHSELLADRFFLIALSRGDPAG